MDFKVMRFISDGAVLQCGEENRIYGTAEPGSSVTLSVRAGGKEICGAAGDADGKGQWMLILPPVEGGAEKHELRFCCGDSCVTVKDVLFGELYHISGQSNMELPMSRTYEPFGKNEFFETEFVREFRVPVQNCFDESVELDDFAEGSWRTAEGQSLMQMSAAGYWFAYTLYKKYGLPVGLLNTSAGGAMAESSFSAEMLRELGGYEEHLKRCLVPGYIEDTTAADNAAMQEWYKKVNEKDELSSVIFDKDTKLDSRANVPFYFRHIRGLEHFSGRLWFRKTFTIEDESIITDGELILGTIIDNDKAYVNGELVGQTDYLYPPRIYKVPAKLLKKGENTLLLCVEVKSGNGGFTAGKNYCLKLGDKVIDLKGEWEYQAAARVDDLAPGTFFQGLPMALYGKMVHPSFRINVKGFVYYQGESNAGAADRYPRVFRTLVEMYRKNCGKDLPVIFTQLPGFCDPCSAVAEDPTVPESGDTSWALMRNKQAKCLEIPDTAMAVILDAGEYNDLHPTNKRTVGERLAMCAESLIYGEKGLGNTVCVKAEYLGESIVLYFEGPELVLKNKKVKYMQLCYEGGKIRDVEPEKMDGHTLMIPMVEYDKPLCVRYAWKNAPEGLDLYNVNGVPVATFAVTVD